MVTQLQEYNGNNHFNNKVIVDFVKKRVIFEPVKVGNLIYHWMYFLVNIIVFFTGPILIIMSLPLFFFQEFNIYPQIYITYLSTVYVLTFGISSFLISLIYFNKIWRTNKFPDFMGTLVSKTMLIVDTTKHVKVVNSNMLQGKKFIIPYFKNVMLEYEATDDYGEYLKNITIDNYFKEDAGKWFCIFEFTKKPIKGELKIQYY